MRTARIAGSTVVAAFLGGIVQAQSAAPKHVADDIVHAPLVRAPTSTLTKSTYIPDDAGTGNGFVQVPTSAPPSFTHLDDDVVYAELGGSVAYDNGTTDPNSDSGNEMSQWVQADDFELTSAASITGAEVDWFDINSGNGWDGGIEWFIFADEGGHPGVPLDMGSGIVLGTTLISNANGWDWFTTSFEFDHPVPLAGSTRYWFGLHWSGDHAFIRDRVFWAYSQEQHFNTSEESLFAAFDNWIQFVAEDRAFRLLEEAGACVTLDFSASDQGPLGHGQDLESPGETFGCVSIAGSPISGGPLGNVGAAIFDSSDGPAGQDPDLMVGQGNILILQNNANAQVLTKSGDRYVHPNDDQDGGTLSFTFCEPVDATTLDLIDIDDANGPGFPDGATVVLFDVDLLTHTILVPDGWTANGGVGTLDLKTLAPQPGVGGPATASEEAGYDGSQVAAIAVTLESSGAVDNLTYCPGGAGALATVRNGSGLNPTILSSNSLPTIGGTWRASLDCSGYGSGLATVLVCAQPVPGALTPFGEALIGGALVHRTAQTYQRSVSPFTWQIPNDLSLSGVEVHAQGMCRSFAGPFRPKLMFFSARLSNAVDLVLGF